MGISKERLKNPSHQCEATAKTTGKRCREYAWMKFEGRFLCGNHFPYDKAYPKSGARKPDSN